MITLEISKQGSHATLRKLKEEGLIVEQTSKQDRRVKTFTTEAGDDLIGKLNQAQDELIQQTLQKVGHDWYAMMEELANYREGFKTIEHLKKINKDFVT